MTRRLPPSLCPHCGAYADAATNLGGEGRPGVGDFTLCADCGGLLRFDTELSLTIPTEADLERAEAVTPGFRARVEYYARIIRAVSRITSGGAGSGRETRQ